MKLPRTLILLLLLLLVAPAAAARYFASTVPQSRYQTGVPPQHKALWRDAPWTYAGTINRMSDPVGGFDFLVQSDAGKAKWEKAADVAVEMGFIAAGDVLVIDAEIQAARLPGYIQDPQAAAAGLAQVKVAEKWIRAKQPRLKITYYGCAPAWAATAINEDTPPDVLAAYDALLTLESQTLSPDVVTLDVYYTGPGFMSELNRKVVQAQRFYPKAGRRILLSPADYSKPGGPYVGKDRWRQMVREAAKVGDVELWASPSDSPWLPQAYADVQDLAAKG